jgi:hypothetical protein
LRFSLIACALVLVASPARAFDDPSQFSGNFPGSATLGASAEGVYFTGAARFASQTCASCHTGGPGKVGLRLNTSDSDLFAVGYQASTVYKLQVELTNEQEGLAFSTSTCTDPPGPKDTYAYLQCNNNNFALEVDDANEVALRGRFCASQPSVSGGVVSCPNADPFGDVTQVATDGTAIFGNRTYDPNDTKTVTRNGATTWEFFWVSPPAGSGPVTFHIGAVDGNGGTGIAANDQDPYGDDTVSAQFFVQEANAPVPTGSNAGCAVAAPRAAGPITLLALLLLTLALRSFRRRARR